MRRAPTPVRGGLPALLLLGAGIVLFALAPAVAVPAPGVAAETVQRATADDEIVPPLIDHLDGQWLKRRSLASHDARGAAQAGREITEFLHDEKILRLEPLAAAAALEGRRELRSGNASAAVAAFELARTLDPQHASAWWGEARARQQAGEGITALLRLAPRAVISRWSSYWTRFADLVALATVLLFALVAAGAAAVVTLVLSHGPEIVHEVEERLPVPWHPAWRSAVGWALLLGPLAVQLLGGFALLVWAIVLAPFAKRAERRLLYGWLLVLALAVPVSSVLWGLASVPVSPAAQVAVASAERALRPDLLTELETLAARHPEEPTWKVLIARLLGARHPDRAIHLLREAIDAAPGDARVRIALGNVYFASNRREPAGVLYVEALRLEPSNVVAMFNLARVRTAMMQTQDAERLLTTARSVAGDEVRRLEQLPSDAVADPDVSVAEVSRKVLSSEGRPALRDAASPWNALTLSALAAACAALGLQFRMHRIGARRCVRCGKAFCGRCAGDDRTGDACTACQQLFGRKEGLAPAARQEQARRVDRRIKSVGRGRAAAQVLWPGLALIHEGRTLLGAAQAALWAFFVIGAFLPARLLPPVAGTGPWPAGAPWVVCGLLFWVAVQFAPLRPAPATRRVGH